MAAADHTNEHGFGLVELLIALTILAVGILAVAGSFISGGVALNRAGRVSTATAIADKQMERYRAIQYCAIFLDSTKLPAAGSTYWSDSPGTPVTDSTCPSGAPVAAVTARQDISGADTPDGRPYRLDTYIVRQTPYAAITGGSREVKAVKIIVRDGANGGKTLARQQSTFDASTGR